MIETSTTGASMLSDIHEGYTGLTRLESNIYTNICHERESNPRRPALRGYYINICRVGKNLFLEKTFVLINNATQINSNFE